MYAVERQETVVSLARTAGRVDVSELAERLAVAPETIRRDLALLEQRGLLRRVHGGALPVERLGFEATLATRRQRCGPEKERIARAALPIALEADSIFLDEGTTSSALADLVHPTRELTIVTTALSIALKLSARPNVNLVAVGGRVRGRTAAVVDHWAVTMLAGLVIDVAFVGTNGLTARGLSCPDVAVGAVKTQALRSARRSVLLADHSKFGADSFAVFAALTDIDTVITDTGTPRAQLDPLRKRGVPVVRV